MTEQHRMAADDAATIVEAVTVELPVDDRINMEREIGRTRASVTLTSGTEVAGTWAAGDCQALRRLVHALMDVTDGATARVDRSQRLVSDQAVGLRQLRDQLRIALDDIDRMRADREQVHLQGAHRIGQLMAEITQLKADLAAAQVSTMTPDAAELLRLQQAFATERRRATAATDRMLDLEEQLAAEKEARANVQQKTFINIRQKAVEAAGAADKAFEEASWKEGERYLKLANMWIGLLAVAPPSPETGQ